MIELGFPAKRKTSHEKEHSLFIYNRGSDVERYTLVSVSNTRRTLWSNGIYLHLSFLGCIKAVEFKTANEHPTRGVGAVKS